VIVRVLYSIIAVLVAGAMLALFIIGLVAVAVGLVT